MESNGDSTARQLIDESRKLLSSASVAQAQCLHDLEVSLYDLSREVKARDLKLIQLAQEVASLRSSNEEKDRKLEALESSTSHKISAVSRQLYPEGSWGWVWEGEEEEAAGREALDGSVGGGQMSDRVQKRELARRIREVLPTASVGLFSGLREICEAAVDVRTDKLLLDIDCLPPNTITQLLALLNARAQHAVSSALTEGQSLARLELLSMMLKTTTQREKDRKGHWSWYMPNVQNIKVPKIVKPYERTPPTLTSLPTELFDMITSLLPSKSKAILCRTSFDVLKRVSRNLYNSLTLTGSQAEWFISGKLIPVPPFNRIRPLLLPSSLNLTTPDSDATNGFFPLTHALCNRYSRSYPPNYPHPRPPAHLPVLNLVMDAEISVDRCLSYWNELLHLVDPVVLQLTRGSKESRLTPPTTFYNSSGMVAYVSKYWTRLEVVVGTGAKSVVVEAEAGKEPRIAFAECLERSRVARGGESVSYYELETTVEGVEAPWKERVLKTEVKTRLAAPAPPLTGREISCRFVMRA